VPAGRARTLDEVYEWDQTHSQGLLVEVEHDSLGRITLPGPTLRFFATEQGVEREPTRAAHLPPPVLDAHAEGVRDWVGS
jgi:crotonobetainyl-CoA:carnitine CoA-transferase CaiB-like acyl-CoA transferase